MTATLYVFSTTVENTYSVAVGNRKTYSLLAFHPILH